MKLKDKIKAAIPPLPSGTYPAVCIGVADIGDQYMEQYKYSSRQVILSFDIPSESILVDGREQPRQLSRAYTCSINKKSHLYALLKSWTNNNMDQNAMKEMDLFSLIGRSGFISVSIDKDGEHNRIDSVMALPKGMPPVKSNTTPIRYDMDTDGFAGEVWDSLPGWVQNRVKKSKQYQEFAPDTILPAPPNEEKMADTVTPQKQETEPLRTSQTTQEKAPMSSSNTAENVDLEGDCPF